MLAWLVDRLKGLLWCIVNTTSRSMGSRYPNPPPPPSPGAFQDSSTFQLIIGNVANDCLSYQSPQSPSEISGTITTATGNNCLVTQNTKPPCANHSEMREGFDGIVEQELALVLRNNKPKRKFCCTISRELAGYDITAANNWQVPHNLQFPPTTGSLLLEFYRQGQKRVPVCSPYPLCWHTLETNQLVCTNSMYQETITTDHQLQNQPSGAKSISLPMVAL